MGFLTGFASGMLEGANNEFAQSSNDYERQMLQREKAVDRVAEQWARDQDKLKSTNNLAVSYQGQYNIPSDLSLTLAQDPAFDRIQDPQTKIDYIKSLKAIPGKMTQGNPGGPVQVVPPTQARNVQLGPFNIPGKNIPGVNTPSYPAEPPRQVYQSQGFDPMKGMALKAVEDLNNWRNPDGTLNTDAHIQALAKVKQGDYEGAMQLMSGVNKQAKNGAATTDPAFNHVASLVGSQQLTSDTDDNGNLLPGGRTFAQKAESLYQSLHGPNKVDWTAIEPKATGAGKDPVKEQQIAQTVAAHPEVDPKRIRDIAYGNIKLGKDVQGQDVAVDLLHGTQEQFTGGPEYTKKQVEDAGTKLNEVSEAVSGLDYARNALKGTPTAAGIPGVLGEKFGGAATTIADVFLGKGAGDVVDRWTQASQSIDFRNAVKTSAFQLALPLIRGAGGKLTQNEITMMENIVGGIDWHHSYQQSMVSFDNLNSLYVRSAISALRIKNPPPNEIFTHPGSPQYIAALNKRGQELMWKNGFTKEFAADILHGEVEAANGRPATRYLPVPTLDPSQEDPEIKAQFDQLRKENATRE